MFSFFFRKQRPVYKRYEKSVLSQVEREYNFRKRKSLEKKGEMEKDAGKYMTLSDKMGNRDARQVRPIFILLQNTSFISYY